MIEIFGSLSKLDLCYYYLAHQTVIRATGSSYE